MKEGDIEVGYYLEGPGLTYIQEVVPQVILESVSSLEGIRGEFLRLKGLKPSQIKEWRLIFNEDEI